MTKTASFMDFELETGGMAFSPRPETELLVEKALDLLSKMETREHNILDIGTGSGNVAIGLTKYNALCRIVALDISDSALRVAMRNSVKYGVRERIEFINSNVFEKIEGRFSNLFDLIISNPPYVSLEDFLSLPSEVKDDPFVALYGGRDGLDFYRRIIKEAPRYLKGGGALLMEVGYNQASSVKDMLDALNAFGDIELYKDYAGIERIIKAIYGETSN